MRPISAKIFASVTRGLIRFGTPGSDSAPHTFGLEFDVAAPGVSGAIIKDLELSDNAGGVARHLGLAEVFERLGQVTLATEEYRKVLEISRENQSIKLIMRRLSKLQAKVAGFITHQKRVDRACIGRAINQISVADLGQEKIENAGRYM